MLLYLISGSTINNSFIENFNRLINLEILSYNCIK